MSPESDMNYRNYYALQMHAEMCSVGAKRAYLVSWDPSSTVIFEVLFDDELWRLVTSWLVKWWDATDAPVPCAETEAIN